MTLTEKINARHVLADEIALMETKLADIDHEIACEMLSNGFERAYGNDGRGFSINRPVKQTFPNSAYLLVNNFGLRHHFEQPPKITIGKLEELRKKGEIDPQQYGQIIATMQTEEGAIGLRKVVDKEKVVK